MCTSLAATFSYSRFTEEVSGRKSYYNHKYFQLRRGGEKD